MIAAALRWLREEARLAGLDSWADGAYDGPSPCTAADPRCARTLDRLAAVAAQMASGKARLVDGRPVTSAAATDVRHTFAQVLAQKAPPVHLVRRKTK